MYRESQERIQQTNVRLGLNLTSRPIGEPPTLAPFARPTSNNVYSNLGKAPVATNSNHPIGAAPNESHEVCGLERVRQIDAVNSANGEWRKVKIGIDSCAALSVTPKDTFPGEIEITEHVGE
jgi:hypothetical protein